MFGEEEEVKILDSNECQSEWIYDCTILLRSSWVASKDAIKGVLKGHE